MSTVAFKGFATGSTVTIGGTATNAWGVAPATVWDTTTSAGCTATIVSHRSTMQVAPDAAVFEIQFTGFDTNYTTSGVAAHDPSFADKMVFWDYGADDEYDFTAPTQVIALDAADGGDRKNSRYSTGPIGSHCFRTPNAAHTIRCAVYEPSSGKWAQASVQIAVADPDVIYAGSRTLFVDTTGNNTNMPAGAQPFINISTALTALIGVGNNGGAHRVLMERDQTHVMAGNFTYSKGNNNVSTFRVEGREGTGSKANIDVSNTTLTFFDFSGQNGAPGALTGTVFSNFTATGNYDPTTGTGTETAFIKTGGENAGDSITLDRVDVVGCYAGVAGLNVGTPNANCVFCLNDTSIDGWGNVGFFGGDGTIQAHTGNRIMQIPEARVKLTNSLSDAIGPVRAASCPLFHMWACDLFSASGWSQAGAGWTAHQPAMKLSDVPSVDGWRYHVGATVMESAREVFSFKTVNDHNQLRYPVSALIEGNLIISGFQGPNVLQFSYGGITFRNNQLVMAGDHDQRPAGGPWNEVGGFFLSTGGSGDTPNNLAAPIIITQNTLVNWTQATAELTDATARVYQPELAFTNIDTTRNFLYQPNLNNPPDVETTQAITPRGAGYTAQDGTRYPQFATPAIAGSLVVPVSGTDGALYFSRSH